MSSTGIPSGGLLGGSSSAATFGYIIMSLSTPSPSTPAEPEQPPTWLVDLDVGGLLLRYATRPVTVRDADGVELVYQGGLSDFELTIDDAQEAQGIEITDRAIQWAALASVGAPLDRCRATLRHWQRGERLEEARVILDGVASDPEYADPDAPDRIVLSIGAGVEVERLWPSPEARVNTSTWDRNPASISYDESVEGAVYPIIFGYPGTGDDNSIDPVPCVPCLPVVIDPSATNDDYFLLCDGIAHVSGSDVYVLDLDGGSTSRYEWHATDTSTDNQGRTVTRIVVPVGLGVQAAAGHKYLIGMARSEGGGNKRSDGQPMQSLLDVALFVLNNSGRAVDIVAQGAESRLADFKIDGILNEPDIELVDWFESNFAVLFPLVRSRTRVGMFWRFLDWRATPAQAQHIINADRGDYTRVSSIRTGGDTVRNVFSLDYGLVDGQASKRLILTSENAKILPWYELPGSALLGERTKGNSACARSQSLYGIRETDPIESAYVWSESTAASALEQIAARDTFPRRSVSYRGPTREIRRMSAGDVALVTDTSAGLSEVVALVASVVLSSASVADLNLVLLDARRIGA
jgi:hypothetical protein